MSRFNLNGLSSYTQAESLASKDNAELAKQQQTFLKNSDRSFSWEQVAKYSGMALMASITGIAAAIAGGTATVGALAITGLAVAAVVSIGSSYIAYKIRANNSLNSNEINASSTGREIAAELRKQPLEVSVSAPEMPIAHTRRIQFYDEAGDNLLLAQASNDEVHEQPLTRIAANEAIYDAKILEQLEPLSSRG